MTNDRWRDLVRGVARTHGYILSEDLVAQIADYLRQEHEKTDVIE